MLFFYFTLFRTQILNYFRQQKAENPEEKQKIKSSLARILFLLFDTSSCGKCNLVKKKLILVKIRVL